jgi:hypothetical protein
MNKIIVNGKSYTVSGSNISIVNGTIRVNGQTIEENLSGIVEVRFEGDLARLEVNHGNAVIKGDVHGSVNAGGDVTCHNVEGNVEAGGDVKCVNVKRNVEAGGDVKCENVEGDIDAGGDVRCGSRK